MALPRPLTWLILLFLSTSSAAQVFEWHDSKGKIQQSQDFRRVPQNAMASLRCLTRVEAVPSGQQIIVEGGHRIRLIGVDVAEGQRSWDSKIEQAAQQQLANLAQGKVVEIKFDQNFKNASFETLGYVWVKGGAFLNAEMLRSGLASPLLTEQNTKFSRELLAAHQQAKAAKRGLSKHRSPRTRAKRAHIQGFSLGLYSRSAAYDYQPFLKEQVAIGATDVLLITPWFLEDHKSCLMVAKKHRTTPLPMVARVVKQAKELGLRVAIMPIVLLWQTDDDHWRGNIKPSDLNDWFLSYQEFIGSFADLAESSGADELIVGSEFSSLEREEKHWRTVIRGVRSRFDGVLSYSANWDHLTVIQFWDALDAIGMTGYHTLTKKDDPTVAELVAAWRQLKATLEKELKHTKKPYFFSEMGYASLDGINKNPWDYVSPETVDRQEQADCYEAWFQVWADAPARFLGAFFYTWWRNNDAEDKRQYTVQGKPAEQVIRKWFRKK